MTDTLRTYFSTYGIPKELATDGGSTFTSYETKKFLSDYGVKHRLSSVDYAHSNKRAELAVKLMKRLLRENVGIGGRLNTDIFNWQFCSTGIPLIGILAAHLLRLFSVENYEIFYLHH